MRRPASQPINPPDHKPRRVGALLRPPHPLCPGPSPRDPVARPSHRGRLRLVLGAVHLLGQRVPGRGHTCARRGCAAHALHALHAFLPFATSPSPRSSSVLCLSSDCQRAPMDCLTPRRIAAVPCAGGGGFSTGLHATMTPALWRPPPNRQAPPAGWRTGGIFPKATASTTTIGWRCGTAAPGPSRVRACMR
jgi:hypothetical protein